MNVKKIFILIGVLLFLNVDAESAFAASPDLKLLKNKNHFAIIRHTRAPGIGDPEGFTLTDCKTQRNLSPEGVKQAQEIGTSLKAALGDNFWVFTSQWCRCKETAKYLGSKNVQELGLLNSFFTRQQKTETQTKQLKKWIQENIKKFHPLVLVSHQVNITALADVFPSEGEVIILKIDDNGQIKKVSVENNNESKN